MRLKTARFSCERHGADSATLTGASLRPPAAGRLARPHCPRALRRPLGPPPDPRGRHTVVPDGIHVTAPPQSAVVWPTVHFLILGLVVHPRCGNSRFVRSGNFLTTHPPHTCRLPRAISCPAWHVCTCLGRPDGPTFPPPRLSLLIRSCFGI